MTRIMNTIFHRQRNINLPIRSLMATSSNWSGRIVARILPKDVPVDYSQVKKPNLARIPPSTFVPGTGIPALRPSFASDTALEKNGRKYNSVVSKSESMGSTSSSTSSASITRSPELLMLEQSTLSFEGDETDEDALSVRIEFFLFPPHKYHHNHQHHEHDRADESNDDGLPLTLVMIRNPREPALQCLKRLELSLAKKLKSYFLDHQNDSHAKDQIKRDQKGSKSAIKTTTIEVSTSLQLDGKLVEMMESEESGMTTEEFWRLSLSRSMQIHMHVKYKDETTTIPMLVECNPPTIVGVNVFEKFHSKIFPGVPLVVEVETAYATDAVVDWYLDKTLVCHNSFWYKPSLEDAHKSVGVVITPTRPGQDGKGHEEAYQFAEKVEETLPENTMLQVRPDWQTPRDEQQQRQQPSKELRVMSYNILADQNAFTLCENKPFVPWVSAETLDRTRRMPLILHEILAYNADVICLQEVDEMIYETLFRPAMNCFNYQGYYSVKCSEGTREGCAIFFSLSRFHTASEADLKVFSISELLSSDIRNMQDNEWKECSRPILELYAKRPDLLILIEEKLGHVLQIAHLRDLNGSPLLIANTHLFYHPNAAHIRALQCFAIALQLHVEQGHEEVPFILCGDFNSELWNCGALLMERKTSHNFSSKYVNWRKDLNTFLWDKEPQSENDDGDVFDDDFPALHLPDSFPKVVSGYPEYPELTHCVVGFQATLDHILMSSSTAGGGLMPVRQAPLPSIEKVLCDVAMPSTKFPSDHMSVLSDILWNPLKI